MFERGTCPNMFEKGVTCQNMFKGGLLPKHAIGYMSLLFIVKLHRFKPHPAWIIAIYSNIMIDRYPVSDVIVEGWGTPMHESSLYIVTSCQWVILPTQSVAKWRHAAHASMTHRCLQEKVLPNDVRVQRSYWVRTTYFYTTVEKHLMQTKKRAPLRCTFIFQRTSLYIVRVFTLYTLIKIKYDN